MTTTLRERLQLVMDEYCDCPADDVERQAFLDALLAAALPVTQVLSEPFTQQAQALVDKTDWILKLPYYQQRRFVQLLTTEFHIVAAQTREACAKIAENTCTDNIHRKPLACAARVAAAIRVSTL